MTIHEALAAAGFHDGPTGPSRWRVCGGADAWLRVLPNGSTPAEAWAMCPRATWLLAFANGLVPIPEVACRSAVLRLLREHAPAALVERGLTVPAEALRALPDDVDWTTALRAAEAAEKAARRLQASPEVQAELAARYPHDLWVVFLVHSAANVARLARLQHWSWGMPEVEVTLSAGSSDAVREAAHIRCADEVRAAIPWSTIEAAILAAQCARGGFAT